MKKDELCHPANRWLQQKLLLTMRLFVVFMLFFSLGLSAETVAQQERVSLKMKEVSVQELFNKIQQQTKLYFLFNQEQVSQLGKITLGVKNETVEKVLNQLFEDTDLTYSIKGNMIIVRQKKTEPENQKQEVKGIKITGQITDVSGHAMPGVTIMVKGAQFGVVSDAEGKYSIEIPEMEGIVLVFSFIGMEKQEVKYDGKKTINIVLKESVQSIDEVVVTGYQTINKRSTAGSISTVKAEDLVINGTQTLEQALQGKLPGVMIINQSGLTGTRQKVRVRGTATLMGNPEPVWVVDGIIQEDPLPFNASSLADINDANMDMIRSFVGGAISWLNPNDIENISVLKDASATAIYGVKAANGVIVITTKKGQKGRMSISYSGNFSTSTKMNYNKLELMNSKERVDVSREAYENGNLLTYEDQIGYTALALAYKRKQISYEEFNTKAKQLETVNTDWFDILFRVPFSHSHNLSISGGSDKTTYHASFGVNENNNTARGNDQKSYNANINVNTIFWDCLNVNVSLAGSLAKTNSYAGVEPFSYAYNTSRVIPCFDENGERYFYPSDANNYKYNILHELENSGNENTLGSINSNLSLRWTIGAGFVFSTTLGYNYSSSVGQSWYTETTNTITKIRGYEFQQYGPESQRFKDSKLPFGGLLNMTESRNNNYTWRNQLEYAKTFGLHVVTAMFGQEIRSNKYDGFAYASYGYMPDRGKAFTQLPGLVGGENKKYNDLLNSYPAITDRLATYVSYYGNMSYMFDERYALNASIRMDASNRFGQDRDARYQPVWSAGIRWNVTKEHWLQEQNILNDVSFRLSYGFQGNVAENVGPDLITKLEAADGNSGLYKMTITRLPSPKLKWEKNKTVNAGFDFSILGSHINGTFEYYYKHTVDMITSRDVPYENGISSMPINGGSMTNQGWDLSFSLVPVRTKNFVWTLGMNTSKVYNKLKSSLPPVGNWEEAVSGNLDKEGYPVSSFWGFRYTGLNPENGGPMFDFSGTELDEAKNDATLFLDWVGKNDPDFTAGLNTTFRYKTLSLSADFYLSTGNKKFIASPYANSNATYTSIPSEYNNMSSQVVNRWRKKGDEKYTNIPALPSPGNSAMVNPYDNKNIYLYPYKCYQYSSALVVDAWYLRCNNISLSYSLPSKWISRFAQDISCSFYMSNPFQIVSKDFHGRDPEVASGAQPLSRNYTFSLNVSF